MAVANLCIYQKSEEEPCGENISLVIKSLQLELFGGGLFYSKTVYKS